MFRHWSDVQIGNISDLKTHLEVAQNAKKSDLVQMLVFTHVQQHVNRKSDFLCHCKRSLNI